MTPQFKAAQARAQRKEAAMKAHENPAQASTAALLAGLCARERQAIIFGMNRVHPCWPVRPRAANH